MKSLKNILKLTLLSLILVSCSSTDKNSGCEECSYTVASGETAGTVPSSLDGIFDLTYSNAQTGSPFTNGTKATFTISNNQLTVEINGKCILLKNPIKTSPSENTFKDTCTDNYQYSVSTNQSGALNEINLSSTTGTGFYGQFKQ